MLWPALIEHLKYSSVQTLIQKLLIFGQWAAFLPNLSEEQFFLKAVIVSISSKGLWLYLENLKFKCIKMSILLSRRATLDSWSKSQIDLK